jgi:hypothetical protein
LTLLGVPEAHFQPRQSLPAVYQQNGYVDIVRPRTVLEQASMTGRVVLPFLVEDVIHELDYPEQIPTLERALGDRSAGRPLPRAAGERHPR